MPRRGRQRGRPGRGDDEGREARESGGREVGSRIAPTARFSRRSTTASVRSSTWTPGKDASRTRTSGTSSTTSRPSATKYKSQLGIGRRSNSKFLIRQFLISAFLLRLVPAFAIGAAESLAIAGLILGPRSHSGLISGIGLFQLALAFEVPRPVVETFFTAGLPAFDRGRARSRRDRRRCCAGAGAAVRRIPATSDAPSRLTSRRSKLARDQCHSSRVMTRSRFMSTLREQVRLAAAVPSISVAAQEAVAIVVERIEAARRCRATRRAKCVRRDSRRDTGKRSSRSSSSPSSSEEFRARDDAVVVVIGAAESFAIEVPFVARDAAVRDCGRAHGTRGRSSRRRCTPGRTNRNHRDPAARSSRARPDPHFVARQLAVAVPVVDFERLRAAAPFCAGDHAVVVRDPSPESESGPWPFVAAAVAAALALVRWRTPLRQRVTASPSVRIFGDMSTSCENQGCQTPCRLNSSWLANSRQPAVTGYRDTAGDRNGAHLLLESRNPSGRDVSSGFSHGN